jgi:hypothetical protein
MGNGGSFFLSNVDRLQQQNNDLVNQRNWFNQNIPYASRQNTYLNDAKRDLENRYNQMIAKFQRDKTSLEEQIIQLENQNKLLKKQLDDLTKISDPKLSLPLIKIYVEMQKKIVEKINGVKQELIGKVVDQNGVVTGLMPGTYTNQYNAIISQNDVIKKQLRDEADRNLMFNNKHNFYSIAFVTLIIINNILFYLYIIFVLVMWYLLYVKTPQWSKRFKIFFAIFIAIFPFVIDSVEKIVYESANYLLAIMKGTPYNNYNASKKDVLKKSTDLSYDK